MAEQDLSELSAAIAAVDVGRIDRAVAALAEGGDPRAIGSLLLSLRDDYPFDEAMFSLVHGAESFADAPYAAALLECLPGLRRTSPRWTAILLQRALNSATARAALLEALSDAGEAERRTAMEVSREIATARPSIAPHAERIATVVSANT